MTPRDDVTRPLADQLREALSRRVEQEHRAWLAELAENLAGGRTVRALRLSSRPPKAGSPLPSDLSTRLADAASAGLTAETAPDRYATVLDALAYSPVRTVVVPQGVPAEPGDALLTAVRKLASRLPQIATAFGVESTAAPRTRSAKSAPRPIPAPPPRPTEAPPAPADEAPVVLEEAPSPGDDVAGSSRGRSDRVGRGSAGSRGRGSGSRGSGRQRRLIAVLEHPWQLARVHQHEVAGGGLGPRVPCGQDEAG